MVRSPLGPFGEGPYQKDGGESTLKMEALPAHGQEPPYQTGHSQKREMKINYLV